VITVGAVNDSDQIANFSSRGPTSDGRVKPDIVFPGVNTAAAQASGTALGTVVAPGYIQISGTSMATPHATGSVALLLQAKPALTPNQAKWVLMSTALQLGENPNSQGSGRANVFDAYRKAVSTTLPDLPNPPEPQPEQPGPEPPIGCREQIRRLFTGR
jgi:serine protease AprX